MAQAPSKEDVFLALTQKTGFEVITPSELPNQLRIVGRCHPNQWNFFVPVIHVLLNTAAAEGSKWTCDISKQYVIRGTRVLYNYRLIFQGENLRECYGLIIATIRSASRPARSEVTEMLLPGSKPGDIRGGVNAKGKGVSSAGSLPLALTRRGG